jgi:hypothetical protein
MVSGNTGGGDEMPDHGLGRAYGNLVSAFAKHHLDGLGFAGIVQLGAGAMSVDIVNIFGFAPAFCRAVRMA